MNTSRALMAISSARKASGDTQSQQNKRTYANELMVEAESNVRRVGDHIEIDHDTTIESASRWRICKEATVLFERFN